MESPNSSPDQEKGEQQPSELAILSDMNNNLESSDHVPSSVSEALRLQMLLLTIAALHFTT
jgi:hypothetical protein